MRLNRADIVGLPDVARLVEEGFTAKDLPALFADTSDLPRGMASARVILASWQAPPHDPTVRAGWTQRLLAAPRAEAELFTAALWLKEHPRTELLDLLSWSLEDLQDRIQLGSIRSWMLQNHGGVLLRLLGSLRAAKVGDFNEIVDATFLPGIMTGLHAHHPDATVEALCAVRRHRSKKVNSWANSWLERFRGDGPTTPAVPSRSVPPTAWVRLAECMANGRLDADVFHQRMKELGYRKRRLEWSRRSGMGRLAVECAPTWIGLRVTRTVHNHNNAELLAADLEAVFFDDLIS